MHSIEAALAVDYVRRGAIGIGTAFLTMVGLPLWLFTALGFAGRIPVESREMVGLHVNLALLMGFGSAVAVLHAVGRLSRFFIRPISAARLVACQMAFGMTTMAAMYLGAVSILNLQGAGWPLVGPALFLATAIACAMTAIWAFEGSELGKVFACITVSIPLAIWFNRCYGATAFGDWQKMWASPTTLDVLTLVGTSLAAYFLAVANVARTRRGDLWTFAAWQAWWGQRWARIDTTIGFTSTRAAFRWLLWRERMGLLPACFLAIWILLLIVLRVVNVSSTEHMLEGMIAVPMAMLLLIVPIVFGLLHGACCQARHGVGMRHVLATRPITDRFLAWETLRSCAFSMALAWGAWLVGIALAVGLALLLGDHDEVMHVLALPKFRMEGTSTADFVPLLTIPVVSWIVASHMTTLIATGRQWFWTATVFLSVGAPLVVSAVRGILSAVAYERLVVVTLGCGLLLLVAGSVWAMVAATRKQLLTANEIMVIAAIGLSACLAIWMFGPSNRFSLVVQGWQSVGLCLLALLPFVTMPLAMHWNRHR